MTKVLVVGDMTPGRNARSVLDGYRDAGHDVCFVSTAASVSPRVGSGEWRSLRTTGMASEREQARMRRALSGAVESFRPDVLVAVKTIRYDQSVFLGLPIRHKVHLSFDDVSNTDNTTPAYMEHERGWDLILTTKRHNIEELRARGAQDVMYIWGAYDPRYRRVTTPTLARRYDIGFIGASRPDRKNLPRDFAEHVPGRGVVVGPRWRRDFPFGVRGVSLQRLSIGEAYTKAANSMSVGLVLLNSDNRDRHTNRSIETPATGQLALAERTDEHLELLSEGEEAEFFSSDEELWAKAQDLLRDRERLRRIADAGHRRITEGRFQYKHRAEETLRHLGIMGT